jgi:hypothetical protein
VRLCLDASVLVSLFATDAHTGPARAIIVRSPGNALVVSDFAAAELASAVARRVRMRDLTEGEARAVLAAFDAWVGAICDRVPISPDDVAQADATVRRLDLSLRAPDAIHLAVADRLGATIATFDRGLAAAADALGIPAVTA